MTDRPLIGVTSSELRNTATHHRPEHGEPPRREMALGLAYLRAIDRAGGIPVVLAPLSEEIVGGLLGRLSGLCLSGGPDLDPHAYGQEPGGHVGPTEPDVDAFELSLIRHADGRGLPILGVCRGAQVINVARGGSLYQDLPTARPSEIAHRQTAPGGQPTHAVALAPGSRVAELVGGAALEVNSFHHQAVDRLGSGLQAVGHAPDGVVEALEDPDRPFMLGVQWHAESLVDRSEHLAVFRGLVDAARRSDFGVGEAQPADTAARLRLPPRRAA